MEQWSIGALEHWNSGCALSRYLAAGSGTVHGGWIMKLYLIVLAFAASITAQEPSLPRVNDLSAGAASVTSGASALQEQSSQGTAKVEGVVRGQFERRDFVPNALVKLFPEPIDLAHPALIRSARTDESGNFEIDNVVPGKYRAIAIQGGGPENLQNEATIAVSAGVRVELAENQSKTLTLYLYPAQR